MTEKQLELLGQTREYFKTQVPKLLTMANTNNHYAFNIYHNCKLSELKEEVDLSDKNTLSTHVMCRASTTYEAGHNLCFGNYLKNIQRYLRDGSQNYRSQFIWLPYQKTERADNNNFTWMTREQLKQHVLYPKTHYGLDYKVEVYSPAEKAYIDTRRSDFGEYYTVLFDFKDLSYIEIKFILFWARYAAEFPSNLALIDALLLKEIYPEEELLNLLIMSSMYFDVHVEYFRIYESQCISICGKFATKEYFLKSLAENPFGDLVPIFKRGYLQYVNPSNPEYDKKLSTTFAELRDKKLYMVNPPYVNLTSFVQVEEVEYRLATYHKLYLYYKSEELRIRED